MKAMIFWFASWPAMMPSYISSSETLVGPGLDHGDARVRGGHRHGHAAHVALGGGGVDHDTAPSTRPTETPEIGPCHGMSEIESANSTRRPCRRSRASSRGRRHITVHDDRNVVAHVLREQRADRAVDHAAGEDRLVGRAALTLEEGAGDFAHGVELLLKIDGEGEEVDALARFGGSRNAPRARPSRRSGRGRRRWPGRPSCRFQSRAAGRRSLFQTCGNFQTLGDPPFLSQIAGDSPCLAIKSAPRAGACISLLKQVHLPPVRGGAESRGARGRPFPPCAAARAKQPRAALMPQRQAGSVPRLPGF